MRTLILLIGVFFVSSFIFSADVPAQMPKFSIGLEDDDGKRDWQEDPTVRELDRKPTKGFKMKLDGGSVAEERMVGDSLKHEGKSLGSEANIKRPEDMGGSHVYDKLKNE
ncbi:hypothetical protein ACFLQ8_00485 [Candidatus Auribacterota bacterium]